MAYILVFRGELEPGVSQRQAAEAIAEKLGKSAGRASRIAGSGEDLEVRISNLMAHPETLRVVLATESAEHGVPFSVTLDQGESVADSIN